MDLTGYYNTAAAVALVAFGWVWGAQAARVSERRRLFVLTERLALDRPKLDLDSAEFARKVRDAHEHIGTVIRCTPFDQLERLGESGISRAVAGTNVLMRCQCGLVWLKWFPGTWTPDDFARTTPVNMDEALRPLTEGGNTP